MANKEWTLETLQKFKSEAEELGISLQEYLLLMIYDMVENIYLEE